MPQGTAVAPVPPLDILLQRLAEFSIPESLCQILCKEATFQEIEFRWQQIVYIRDIAEGEHHIPISINGVARDFECPRNRVQ
jgi:hypothetical protein